MRLFGAGSLRRFLSLAPRGHEPSHTLRGWAVLAVLSLDPFASYVSAERGQHTNATGQAPEEGWAATEGLREGYGCPV